MKPVFLLTDVLPYEIPLIITNKNLYNYIKRNGNKWKPIINDIKDLKKNKTFKDITVETKPTEFQIIKNEREKRRLYLPHPLAQLSFLLFNDIFSDQFLTYFKLNGEFSLRCPIEINPYIYISGNKLTQETDEVMNQNSSKKTEKDILARGSFYSKNKFYTLPSFYNSNFFKYLEKKK
jgi:hypothetical protein